MTEVNVDLEAIDSENKRAGMSVIARVDAITHLLGPGATFPESLLQDMDSLEIGNVLDAPRDDD